MSEPLHAIDALTPARPFAIIAGNCLDTMAALPSDSIDAVVSDPPYGLAFMGKAWDHGVPGIPFWAEALRIAKPGAHLLAFGGTRTYHRLTCAIEDAGWQIRDCLSWLYGSGFPKSLDVAKAIDSRKDWGALEALQAQVKAAREALGISQSEAARRMGMIGDGEALGGGGYMWFETGRRIPTRDEYPRLKAALELDDSADLAFEAAERDVIGEHTGSTPGFTGMRFGASSSAVTAPSTDAAKRWEGWGTALKPSWEPIIMARKPLRGTVARTVLQFGTGALNVDGCMIGDRWPANVMLDESAAAMLDAQSGELVSGANPTRRGAPKFGTAYGEFRGDEEIPARGADTGGASRFFYTAKASRAEREAGLEDMERAATTVQNSSGRRFDPKCIHSGLTFHNCKCGRCEWDRADNPKVANTHPTVKPIDVMRWLCRLVTPPNGIVLDPFTGSGTTGCAAMLEGFRFIGCELETDYVAIAEARVTHWHQVAKLPESMRTTLEKATTRDADTLDLFGAL